MQTEIKEETMKTKIVYEKPEMIEYPYFGICGAGESDGGLGEDLPITCNDFGDPA